MADPAVSNKSFFYGGIVLLALIFITALLSRYVQKL